ncbi:unnamed protein product [Ectocarpus fasciculatus]
MKDGDEDEPSNAIKSERRQRKTFRRELDAMIRLRSPNTVHVYGKITALRDRLVLVMELLVGGDLRMLLNSSHPSLPAHKSRRIIGDICAGMAFLHSKNTIHGDLKSSNVLLDGDGRAKIGDFGTTRWTQHSTGLASHSTAGHTTFSLEWSAPEVLEREPHTFKSDVYSFGVVVWEVITTEVPWANKTRLKDIFCAVIQGDRPEFPAHADDVYMEVATRCWTEEANERPSFRSLMADLR